MRTWPALDVRVPSDDAAVGVNWTDLYQASLLDYPVTAIDESAAGRWRVFFDTASDRDRAIAHLSREFPGLVCTATDVDDENWAARSQANLRAVRVGRIIVAPPWDAPRAEPADAASTDAPPLVVVIEPSMGFGTAHHATTRLCLAALQTIDLHRHSVLDVGTGSGVLAIAASLLGADPVVAIDEDADAIGCARDNLTLNPGARVAISTASLQTAVLPVSDLVVANLTGGLLMQAAARLQGLVVPTGHLILSGLMHQEEAGVLASFPRMRLVERTQEDEWLCLHLRHEGAFR